MEAEKIFTIERFAHNLRFSSSKSDLRIQLQIGSKYQLFVSNSSIKNAMEYKMRVASVEDILQGKVWAYSDEQRRNSKRQKDLADIYRLIESYPHLKEMLPKSLKDNENV